MDRWAPQDGLVLQMIASEPGSPRIRRLAGLTLIELLVTLAILAMVAATTGAALSKGLDRVRFNGAAREVANALKSSRQQAVATQRERVFVLDVEAQRYTAAGRERVLNTPRQTTLVLLTAETEQVDLAAGNIRFFPDGSSTGGKITLSHGGRESVVAVDWLTGRVDVSP